MLNNPVQNKADIYKILSDHKSDMARYGVQRLGLFGSFVRQEQNPSSDVDLLVDFAPGKKKYSNFISLTYFLENVLQRQVELVTRDSLTRHLKPHIEKEVEYAELY